MHLFSARRPLIRALCILLLCAGLPVSASASDTQDVLFLSTPSPAPTMAPAPLPTEPPLHAPDTLSPIAAALPTALPIHADIVSADGKSSSFTRDTPVNMPAQAAYSDLAGVLTFRGGPDRQNAAYGFVNPQRKTLRVVWEKKIGAIDNWSGVGWNGQPAIVRWPDALRAQMNLHAAKQTPGLCEVIYAALDGNIYFLDLSDGAETRAPIRVGFPIKGSVSIDPRGIPLLYSGQGISRNGAKRGKIGLHIFNLLDQSELYLLNGRDKDARRAHGAFDSVPLVDAQSDTLLAAGENGLFYTLSLHTQYDAAQATLSIAPTRVAYRYRTGKTVGMENSPAVWGHFAYFADNGGYLQCVDLNTLTLVWGASVSDDTDATIALEPEANGHLALYTACEVDLRKKNAPAFLRRFNAQTGALDWEVAVPCAYDPDLNGGV
ncbi:MAG: pyrrolo-quinoline quinone, partial [Clostridia bacterium]